MEPLVSIVIPYKNQVNVLVNSIPVILEQETSFDYEVLFIDTGSIDSSAVLVENFRKKDPRIRVLKVDPSQFHHAETRNMGISEANGKYVVFLNGDALPTHTSWLHNLVTPMLDDPSISAVYGRQEPDINADINNICRMTFNYGSKPIVKNRALDLTIKDRYFFSTVNCCIDVSRFEGKLFSSELPVNEDIVFSKKAIDAGHTFVYLPDANVTHSHNLSPLEVFKRYYDNGVVYKKAGIIGQRGKSLSSDGKAYLKHSIEILKKKTPRDWVNFFIFSACAVLGAKVGEYYFLFPKTIRKNFGLYTGDVD